MNWIAIRALIVLLVLLSVSNSQASITVTPSSNIINQPAVYTFILNLGSSTNRPGTATLSFNATGYSFSNDTAITGCYNAITTSTRYNCWASSSTSISFRWNTTMSSPLYLSISTITNPTYVDNYVVGFSYAPDVTASFTTLYFTISSFQPDSLTSCSMSFSPNYTNTLSNITFTIVNKNSIPAGGSLQLTFSGYTPTASSLAIYSSSSSVNTSAVITFDGSSVFFMNGFFRTLIAAGTSLSFSIAQIEGPPTISSSLYSITILTSAKDSFFYKIDQRTCSISNIANFPTASMSVEPSSTMLVGNTQVTTYINFVAPTDVDFTQDTITITVLSSSTTYLTLYYLSVPVTTNVTGGGLTGTNTTNGITFPTASTSISIAAGTAVQFRSGLFSSSLVNSGTRTVALQFFRNGNSYSYNTASFTVSPNTLLAASLSVLSSTVSATTTYTFNLQINNPLGIGAGVRITLPSSISITTGTCTATASLSISNALSSVVLCSASTTQSIFVSNITSAVIASGTTITLQVQNIKNPTTTQTTSSLVYQTYYSLSETTDPVDDSSGYSITFTPSPVTIPDPNFSVTSRSSTTNLQYASYTFSYTVYTTFPANGIINLILPSNMLLSTSATATYTLSSNPTSTSVPVTSTTTLSATTIVLNFNGLITSTLSTGTVFTIIVSNIRNYYSYKPISIQLISYTSNSFAVEQSNSAAIALANSAPDTTLTAGVSTSNTVNGQSTSYTLTLVSPAALTSSDLISLELATTNNANTQLAYSTTVTCSVNSVSTNCSRDLSNTRLLLITTGSAITASTTATVTINNLILARSLDQPGNILVKTYQSSSGLYLISSYTLTPPANSLTNLITAASLSIIDSGSSSARLNVPTTFTLSLSPTNTLISGDFIVVTVPSEWTNIQSSYVVVSNTSTLSTMTGSLCTGTTVFCSNYLGDPSKIRVDDRTGTAFPGVTNISFTISSSVFVSPKDWASSYSTFSFVTYTNNSFRIDASNTSTVNSAQFTLACPNSTSFHCKTCNSTGFCTACYQLGDGYDTTWNYGGYFVRQSTGECVSSCGANYYNNSNFCDQCTSPCYSCTSGSTSSCTSCIAPTVLTNSTCLASCADGYYNNSGVCAACTSPCATCQTSSSTCLSCNNGTYLNGNTCGSNCNGVTGTYADSTTWTCAACITNCSSCSVTASNCTACASTYFLTGTNVCTQNCPSGQAKLNDTTCTCNYTACLTCALTINTCTSCTSGLVLKNAVCTTSCGDNYYLSNSTCVACVANCQTCSASGCTVCNSTASILYNGSCYSSCPSGTSASGTSCVLCSTGCSTCSTASFCTQCQSIFYLVIYVNGTAECVRPCPTDYPYLDSNICVSSCSSGKSPDSSNTCVSSSNSNSNNSGTTTTLTSEANKIVPFPMTIALAVFSVACLASKVALPFTIIAACLCAFAGLTEVLSWLVFAAVAGVSTDSSANLTKTGMTIVLVSYFLTVALNVIAIIFFRKYIWNDDKFQLQLKKLRMKTKCGVSVTYTIFILSVAFSHKILEIIFSNLFQAQYFIYKVTQVNKFTPLNYIRYLSLICTVLSIAGAAMANYEVQTLELSSLAFIQSIDLIVVTLLSAIIGIWATVRKADLYETTLAEKRNDMEQELEHDPIEDDINQYQSEANKNLKKKYTFSSSIRNTDPKEDPLKQKMMSGKNPIGEEYNITNMPLDNHDDEIDRIDLNQTNGASNTYNKRLSNGLGIDDIGFQEEQGNEILPNKVRKNQTKQQEKSRLKSSIEKKLNKQERAKTKVIRDVDTIHTSVLLSQEEAAQQQSENNLKQLTKNQAKRQRLEVLSNTSSADLSKLPEEERTKAGEMKDAMNLLKAKKVNIGEYLDYLDIIEEEDQDKDSDLYQNQKMAAMNSAKKQQIKKSTKKTKGELSKSIRKDRSARYPVDDKLFVNSINDSEGLGMFDDDIEPQPPNFHNRPRNQSEDYSPNDIEDLNFSGLRSSANNRSETLFKKPKIGSIDMVVVSLESGDNDDPSLGQQFQKGNTLKQTEKDELPPSNMYATQKMIDSNKANINSFPKDRMARNRLINDDDHIEYIESQGGENQTVANQLLDYNNDISPSQFDEPNLRIENDETSNAPTRPKVPKRPDNFKRDNNDQALEITNLEDVEEDYDQFERAYGDDKKSGMHRYQSDRNLDYDDILYQKRKNQKMKQLEQIYLPRQQVPRAYKPKRRLNQSTNSHREAK